MSPYDLKRWCQALVSSAGVKRWVPSAGDSHPRGRSRAIMVFKTTAENRLTYANLPINMHLGTH